MLQYNQHSITTLVEQLESLGEKSVQIKEGIVMGVVESYDKIKRFKNIKTNQLNAQYITVASSQKKYRYHHIAKQCQQLALQIYNTFKYGYHTNIITHPHRNSITNILNSLHFQGQLPINATQYNPTQTKDILSDKLLVNHQKSKYYSMHIQNLISILPNDMHQSLFIIGIIDKQTGAQLKIISLPNKFLAMDDDKEQFTIIRKQVTQILNYISTNPSKRYQQLNQIMTKRHPITNILSQIILDQTINFGVHFIDNNSQVSMFEFFDKLIPIRNLVKKNKPNFQVYPPVPNNHISKPKPTNLSKSKSKQPLKKQPQKQLQFCRDLERKTHKYSIIDYQEDQKQNEQINKQPSKLNNNQQIALLKAEHSRQISQYHSTIQTLNNKILALTKQSPLQQIINIYQKEIIMLQLKIKQLRNDIAIVSNLQNQSNHKLNQQQSHKITQMKKLINKLNQQIISYQQKMTNNKVNTAKYKMMEKQLAHWREKYDQSQKARKLLLQQIKALTNRLNLHSEKVDILPSKDIQIFQQIKHLLNNATNQPSLQNIIVESIHQKIIKIMSQVSEYRQIILQCNDFLVELQTHIQSKLGLKDPQIVLDCNRFIRSFLLANLNVF